ncbi:MAG: hypothetical protein EP298_04240 [Gammaproteobacteria bacterium]|nr:MAG: hypothetical protein EP298_04240 [Gammaproteobacteria bacterium]UTW43840.1 hypothetical protein KFE69_07050 [bacterium SCSIO 12844]
MKYTLSLCVGISSILIAVSAFASSFREIDISVGTVIANKTTSDLTYSSRSIQGVGSDFTSIGYAPFGGAISKGYLSSGNSTTIYYSDGIIEEQKPDSLGNFYIFQDQSDIPICQLSYASHTVNSTYVKVTLTIQNFAKHKDVTCSFNQDGSNNVVGISQKFGPDDASPTLIKQSGPIEYSINPSQWNGGHIYIVQTEED